MASCVGPAEALSLTGLELPVPQTSLMRTEGLCRTRRGSWWGAWDPLRGTLEVGCHQLSQHHLPSLFPQPWTQEPGWLLPQVEVPIWWARNPVPMHGPSSHPSPRQT